MNKFETLKQFDVLNTETLTQIEGGKGGGSFTIPLPIPKYEELLSSICGFIDGITGRKHKGSC
ncbi:TPA: ComC/BlpC family leader-containing pheromone/bacteriocin [Streptococcus suis]|nr:ComC/BlpC family leader-containing pheromone/bacteriocin [Streptococcus suis]HEM2582137.1 ComC/BlpC family leader-containing pheromone/bacteriocin [Streptococcus suis]HEP1781000.1 ComC/BlpC family leader-containing pheromone/bacteriocin [Streptococcus suis]HEP1840291.1 ComC/BlpC family leader-containing pheromone/bacteriocin [Streptococcus suis]